AICLLSGAPGAPARAFVERAALRGGLRLILIEPASARPDPGDWARALEPLGAEVWRIGTEMADPARLCQVMATVRERFGPVAVTLHTPSPQAPSGDDPAAWWTLCAATLAELDALRDALAAEHPEARLVLLHAPAAAADPAEAARARTLEDWSEAEGRLLVSWPDAADGEESGEILARLLATEAAGPVLVSPGSRASRPLPGGEPAAAAGRYERPELATGYAPPRNEAERRVAEIWEQLLGLERVGVHDDFFELGGHSLLATRVLSRLRDALGAELSVETFFTAATVAGLAQAVEASRAAGPGREAPPLAPRPRGGEIPLSFAQLRLWFLDQWAPGLSGYNMPTPLRLRGGLDPSALHRALTEIVRRHEALRTVFPARDGEPYQRVLPPGVQPLPRVDLEGLPPALREAETLRVARTEARLPFDLERGPLMRTALVRLSARDHALLTTTHHIVSDGWSLGIFTREMAALYAAFSAGDPSPLPELPVQYADFALWQRDWLRGEVLEEQLAWWRGVLVSSPAALELPTDRPRPPFPSFRGAVRTRTLAADLAGSLRALGQAHGTTPFMTLLAVFATLLSRYTGQTDVVLGSPIANRNRSEIEGLIGFFANTLVLRTDLGGDPAFTALLERIRPAALAAFARQDLPFERLVEDLRPYRDVSRQPLFQVLFAVQNVPPDAAGVAGLELAPIRLAEPPEHFDLSLFVDEADGAFHAALRFSTDLFDGATAARMLEHLATLAAAAAADPSRPVSALPLLPAHELHQVLYAWNDGLPPAALPVHERVDGQARRTPDAPAILGEDGQLTFRELAQASDRLAGALQSLGIGPEDLVGVCLPRVPEIAVALLGILKAGGVYLPLDPAYPRERLAYMLEQARAPLVLGRRDLAGQLPAHGARTLFLDELEPPAAPTGRARAVEPAQAA
ncbi:MAG TPA: condensation domain-containing protein, partial [Thermoanaerobaculia bacterium]|nr:condensation domain-containing protein [Thermoanaerobaculia bacterium]